MFRTLLTTTAIAALLATGAIAQETTTPAAETPAMEAPATTAKPVSSILASGYTVTDKDNLATEIIGQQVYSSAETNAEHIGDVNNLVVGNNGQIAAVIIGVGGFLGMGEKNVAVNYSELQWVTAGDNTKRFVLPTTKDALKAAPDFHTVDAAAPVATTTAPADTNAMAPATETRTAAAPIARDTLTTAPLTAEELIGTNAYGPGDEHLGTISDVVLGQDGKTVEALVIDFGGFLGIGTKPVAVGVGNVRYAKDTTGGKYLFLNVTRDQLDKAVAYNKDTFAAERSTQLLSTEPLS